MEEKTFIFQIRDRKYFCVAGCVSDSGGGIVLKTLILHVRTGTAWVDKNKDTLDFLNS